MTVVIDATAFQLGTRESASAWANILPYLSLRHRLVILDRGAVGSLPANTLRLPFPNYRGAYTADDSILIERACRHLGASLFISTHCTTPLTVPSIGVFFAANGFREPAAPPTDRSSLEFQLLVAHARRHLCMTETIKADLISAHPELDPSAIRTMAPSAQPSPKPGASGSSSLSTDPGAIETSDEYWRAAAGELSATISEMMLLSNEGAFTEFYERWGRLRMLQARVDTVP